MELIMGARESYWHLLVIVITALTMSGCAEQGIYQLGEQSPNNKYQGVLICGEVITINATQDVSDTQLVFMFNDALEKRQACEAKFKLR